MRTRHVKRRPAKPFADNTPIKGRVKAFFLSFTPKYFKEYWISRAGAIRLGKLAGAGVVFIFLVFLWYAKDLPTPGKINARIQAQTTRFYDSTGNKLIYEVLGDKNRSIVTFDQISKEAKNATLAIEDKDFYKHGSFSIAGYMRAAIADLTKSGVRQGGSTITQQYVKNALLDPTDFSISRKIKELILSIEIGQFYSKDTILTLYLNEIPYGNRAYGIESACKAYFPQDIDHNDKDQHCAKNLTLEQSALLAAILNGPSYYSPFGSHKDALIDRQHLVLDLMAEQGYVTKAEAEAAKWQVADLANKDKISQTQNLYANLDPMLAYFVLYTQEYLEAKYGATTVTEGGLKVTTTIDLDKQKAAYDAIQNNMKTVTRGGGSNAALVSTDPKTGHILAMIGGHDFNDPDGGQVNVATRERQPGSSFKPIVYATLFGKNKDAACAKDRSCSTYGPGTTIYDVPTSFGGTPEYKPNNFGNKSYGVLTARQALAGSLNIPAVKALAMAGVSNSLQTAQSLGISTLDESASTYGLSLVLGTGGVQLTEMANAYESFANGGLHHEQTPILTLKDQKGNTMEDNTKSKKGKQAIDPQVAYLMADMMSDNNAKQFVFGNELALRNNCPNNQANGCVHVGVKTGTTEHFNDAWTVGYTQDMTAGVWVGNNDGSPMGGVAAANIAGPIWKAYMNAVINGKANSAFSKPNGIKTVTLDKQTGRSVTAGTKTTTVDVFPSWYTAMSAAGGKNAQVDKISGKLATDCTPPLARDTVYSSAIQPEITKAENPSQYQLWLTALQKAGYSTGGGDLPTESDDKHSCSDTKPTVNIVGADGDGPFTVQVESGTFTANKLQVYLDDQIISTQDINGSGSYPVSYPPNQSGSHTIKAVVTDAALYQATDEQTVVISGGGSGGAFFGVTPADGSSMNAGSVTFTWSAATGASSYRLIVDGVDRGGATGTAKTMNVVTPGNHTWYVKADTGDTTDTLTFKIH